MKRTELGVVKTSLTAHHFPRSKAAGRKKKMAGEPGGKQDFGGLPEILPRGPGLQG